MIPQLPSYISGDFDELVQDLYYFIEEDDDTYSIGKVESFTKKWRKRKVESLDQFKRYHRKYLELVGKALGSHNMTDQDCNRYFWEGLHYSLRRRIEDRMLVVNPNLDVSVPFGMSKVARAVGYLFNKKRFDQHLLSRTNYDSSDSGSNDEGDYKPRQMFSDSEEERGQDSDDSDSSRIHSRRRSHHHERSPTPKKGPKHSEAGSKEITQLVH